MIKQLLSGQKHSLSDRDLERLVYLTDGYSASDLKALCQDAAMGPIREMNTAVLVSRLLHMISNVELFTMVFLTLA